MTQETKRKPDRMIVEVVKYEITDKGSIQLFDKKGLKIPQGTKGTYWKGDFNCSSNKALKSLEGAPETVGGDFYCSYNNSLTSLEGAPETVGGNFYCSYSKSLKSLEGAPETVGGSFYCSNNKSLKSLKGAPETVGGIFYCPHNRSLKSLEGAPETVGGNFRCYHNPSLKSLKGIPLENQDMFKDFYKKGFVFADGILTKLIHKRGDVYKTHKIGNPDKIVYVIKEDDDVYAHGETLKQARDDLAFKKMSKDTSQFKEMPLDTVKTPIEWSLVYRAITGACEYGTNEFIKSKGSDLKDTYTLKEILELTKDAYLGKIFKEAVA